MSAPIDQELATCSPIEPMITPIEVCGIPPAQSHSSTETTDVNRNAAVNATQSDDQMEQCSSSGGAAMDQGCAILLKPLPSYMNIAQFENMLRGASVDNFLGVFKNQNRDCGTVTFENVAAKQIAVERINAARGVAGKDNSLHRIKIKDASFVVETASQKRQRSIALERSDRKRARNSGDVSLQVTESKPVSDVVTPWAKVSYEVQIAKKLIMLEDALSSVLSTLRKDYKNDWKKYPQLDLKGVNRNQPVPVSFLDRMTLEAVEVKDITTVSKQKMNICCPIVSAHAWHNGREGYRNKTEFTIGLTLEGEPCVGFITGRTEGRLVVGPGHEAINANDITQAICRDMQAFVKASSHDPFVQLGDNDPAHGVFRRLLVRSAMTTGQVMIAVQADTSRLSSDQVAEFESDLVRWFASNKYHDDPTVTSRQWTVHTITLQSFAGYGNVTPVDIPVKTLLGPGHIVEFLGKLAFKIQPTSFFQVNTHGAQVLYLIAGDWALGDIDTISVPTILADVCCGTGTIGMSLHDRVESVLGFELVQSAVDDAIANAADNKLDHCQFFVGKAEDTLAPVIDQQLAKGGSVQRNVVAIVDPPRPGLHKTVLRTLRSCSALNRIVYVSCNPKSMADDIAALVRPTSAARPGLPFVINKATLVDMFPHTPHAECIVLLTRASAI